MYQLGAKNRSDALQHLPFRTPSAKESSAISFISLAGLFSFSKAGGQMLQQLHQWRPQQHEPQVLPTTHCTRHSLPLLDQAHGYFLPPLLQAQRHFLPPVAQGIWAFPTTRTAALHTSKEWMPLPYLQLPWHGLLWHCALGHVALPHLGAGQEAEAKGKGSPEPPSAARATWRAATGWEPRGHKTTSWTALAYHSDSMSENNESY